MFSTRVAGRTRFSDCRPRVLNYFDGVHLARRATAPALFSVALFDDVCPPSTVFASYNSYGRGNPRQSGQGSTKSIEIYHFNGHEGGQEHHWVRQLRYLAKKLANQHLELEPRIALAE